MVSSTGIVLFGVASVIFPIIILYFMRKYTKRHHDAVNLNAPLIATEEYNRQDAATKEASEGFNVCACCGFENFKSAALCGLCGDTLATSKNSKRADSQSHAPSSGLRKQRARTRKQWQRKVDVEGSLYWYRSTTQSGNAKPQFPGYTVLFCHDPQKAAPGSSSLVTDMIHQECAGAKLELVESSRANPAISPFGGHLDPRKNRQELIDFSNQVFPKKFAAFTAESIASLAPTKSQVFRLQLSRKFVLEQSMEKVGCMPLRNVRSGVKVEFTEDPRVRENMQREWFAQVSERLANPSVGLFKCVNKADQTFYLNPHSEHDIGEDHLPLLFAAGRLLGRGLLEGNLWEFHFSLPLLKIILGLPVSLEDLQFFDPEMYKNLVWLVETNEVESLGLTFSVSEKVGDELLVVDLIPNGRDIAVTNANKSEYLERKFKYTLFESVAPQLFAFLKGVYEVVPQQLLLLFDAEELDYVLCGSDEIDVNDWKNSSKHTPGLQDHPVLKYFWQVVEEMPLEYKKRLLQFTTGCSRVPLGGFRELTNYAGRQCPFTLRSISIVDSRVVRAQSCFNSLTLPLFIKKKDIKNALYTILDAEMYQHISD